MTDFGGLVRSGSVPSIEGLFHVDGTVRRIDDDGPRLSRFEVGLPFVPTWREHQDGLVDIDWADRAADSNPFLQARTDGAVATFTNNLRRSLVIDLRLPHFALHP